MAKVRRKISSIPPISGYTPEVKSKTPMTPTAHASTHATAGSDAVSAASIDALPDTSFVGLTHIYVQATAPTSPSPGDLWVDTSGS